VENEDLSSRDHLAPLNCMLVHSHTGGNSGLNTCRFGVDIQRMVYAHMLPAGKDDPVMLLHLWGCNDETLPLWQRIALRLLLPVLVKFVSQVRPFQDTSGLST